ncbi:hypothetical protein H310_05251 [Aphanomyces invadans]|uniref:Serine/threonine-protein phosphatase n=1 Tax=Aphanomyces invadans TaxID=157072 RepID=A0A024UA38_9STRA|nr:hypothetical protein H310_05251 [Aphanomyces invadans]ETW02752.1 hypothetical protein H310_05251 [Aphanomyces invadans]|eukprot:XP_008868136.1 hypothetical protein H310_05251 [Aphanomyces invadans]
MGSKSSKLSTKRGPEASGKKNEASPPAITPKKGASTPRTLKQAEQEPTQADEEPPSRLSESTESVTDDERFSSTQWKLFNDLENREEAEMFELSSFLRALHDHMPSTDVDYGDLGPPPPTDSLRMQHQVSWHAAATIDITDMYEGILLNDPLTKEDAHNLVESFKRGQKLHRNFAMHILTAALQLFQHKPNITEVSITPSPHITIVGDLHGQLDDLLLIFRENGMPGPENPYIFNGDIVDRGTRSIECALIIFTFAVVFPDFVHINRGNHEDKSITEVFGFMKECLLKYDSEVYAMFCVVFKWLPIGTILDKRILILHGGIPRDATTKLHDLSDIPRHLYDLSMYRTKGDTKESRKLHKTMRIVKDILWSDPHTVNGWKENPRGAGINYGQDHVYKYMVKNRLELIIRSHECVPKGFDWPFGAKGMLVTLFSASNYCGVANNMGCFMRIPRTGKPSFFQYMATTSESDLVATNLEGLFDIIVTHREDLLRQFQAVDSSSTQCVSTAQWDAVMQQTLQMHLNWASIRPLLTSTEANQTINYVNFLNRYQARGTCGADDAAATPEGPVAPDVADRRDMFNNMYRYRKRLQALFQVFDQDGNGTINLDEFKAGIDILNKHLPPGMKPFTHAEDLMKSLDLAHDNEININEFMECFRIHANLTVQAKWRRARTKLRALQALGMLKVIEAPAIVTASDVQLDVDESETKHRDDDDDDDEDLTHSC